MEEVFHQKEVSVGFFKVNKEFNVHLQKVTARAVVLEEGIRSHYIESQRQGWTSEGPVIKPQNQPG